MPGSGSSTPAKVTRRTSVTSTSSPREAPEPSVGAAAIWRIVRPVFESLQRGMRVIVTGRLKQRNYQTKEGAERTVY
jgi:single-strand DNA-binding protein